MRADLSFRDARLEAAFRHELFRRRRHVVSQFALLRVGILTFVAIQALLQVRARGRLAGRPSGC